MNPYQAANSQNDQGACGASGTSFQYPGSNPSISDISFSAGAEAVNSHDDCGQSQDRPPLDSLVMMRLGVEPHHQDMTQQVQRVQLPLRCQFNEPPFSHLLQHRYRHLHWVQDVAGYRDAPRVRGGLDHPLLHLQAHRRPADQLEIGPLHRRQRRMFGHKKRCVSNLRRERARTKRKYRERQSAIHTLPCLPLSLPCPALGPWASRFNSS